MSDRDVAACAKLRRSAEGRAVPLPGIFSGTDADVTMLALGFARAEVGALAVPYARWGVGVTAVSHKVIRNLLEEVVRAAAAEAVTVRCMHRVSDKSRVPRPGIDEETEAGKAVAKIRAGTHDVVGIASCEGRQMATPTVAAKSAQASQQAELEEELRQAEADFANGDYIELTVEELDQCIAAGEWPWQRASSV